MIKEHERVVLKSPVPDKGLEAGDVGKVVHVYRDGEAYELGVRRFGWAYGCSQTWRLCVL